LVRHRNRSNNECIASHPGSPVSSATRFSRQLTGAEGATRSTQNRAFTQAITASKRGFRAPSLSAKFEGLILG
jgi:hypothetical protein